MASLEHCCSQNTSVPASPVVFSVKKYIFYSFFVTDKIESSEFVRVTQICFKFKYRHIFFLIKMGTFAKAHV